MKICQYLLQVVEKRMVDNIAQLSYHLFITECALSIDQSLTSSIPLSELIKYMREPYETTDRREKLTKTIQAYQDALQVGLQL